MKMQGLQGLRSQSNLQNGGFTMTELLVATVLSTTVIAMVILAHLFGLRVFNLTVTKLRASQSARAALNQVREDVRTAQTLVVGTGNSAGFSNLPANTMRQGNALQIYTTNSTNIFIRYYMDATDQTLKRITSSGGAPQQVAAHLTNQIAFRAETYTGTIMTNDINVRVVRMSLEFKQWDLPPNGAGQQPYYDYYQLHTRIARRTH